MRCAYRSAAVAIVLVAGCLSACSSSGSGGSPGSSGPGGPASSGVSKGGSGSPSQPKAKATCDQLTVADVQPLVASPVTKAAPETVGPTDDPGQDCVFDDSDDSTAVDVTVLSGTFGQQAYASDVKDQTHGSVPISGVGDKASHDKGDLSVSALSGSLYCSVRGEGEAMPGIGDWESAHGGTSTLPDSIVEAAVAVLGTVCNRIFGSGNTTPDLAALKSAVAAAA